ncbi:MAG: hypothetical protein IJ703_09100 [Eubacterium sp.]|nr:hypothetical protein [Eubacterium sp.]
MFCIICGAEISETEKNCPKCGAHVPEIPNIPVAPEEESSVQTDGEMSDPSAEESGGESAAENHEETGGELVVVGNKLPADPEGDTAELAVVPGGKNELALTGSGNNELVPYEPPKKKGSKKLLMIILAAVVLVAGIITAVVLLKNKKADPKDIVWSENPKGKHISADELPYTPQLYSVLSKLYTMTSSNQDGDSAYYNSRKAAEDGSDILYNILKTGSVTDFSLYSVDEAKYQDTRNGASMDPWGKAASLGSYNEYYKESVIWIARNIFNVSDDDIDTLTEKANARTGDAMGYYLNKGKYYFYGASTPSKVKQYYEISIGDVTYDGRYYYINYFVDLGAIDENGQRVKSSNGVAEYAVMELKDVDGDKYWSVYYHSSNIPKKLESTEYTEFKDIIGSCCAKYAKNTGLTEKNTSYTVSEEWSPENGTSWMVQVFEAEGDYSQGKQIAYYIVHKDCMVYDWWDMSDDPKNIPVFIKEK